MPYQIKDWKKFQHFKDRRPPWIKFYRDLLDDPDWHALSGDDAKMLVMLWLIASDDKSCSGFLPDLRNLAFRLRKTERVVCETLARLSHYVIQDDITPISSCHQHDTPETETETETETENKPRKKRGGPLVEFWMEEYRKQVGRDYVFQTKDGVAISRVVKAVGEDQYKRMAVWLLTTQDKWYCDNRTPTILYSKINDIPALIDKPPELRNPLSNNQEQAHYGNHARAGRERESSDFFPAFQPVEPEPIFTAEQLERRQWGKDFAFQCVREGIEWTQSGLDRYVNERLAQKEGGPPQDSPPG